MRLTEIRPADDVPRLAARIASDRGPWAHSTGWRHRLKSGEIIDVEITSHTLAFAGRRAALVTAQDVTDRTKTEAALHERTSLTALTADVGVALNRPQPLRASLGDCARAAAARLDLAGVHIWTANQTGACLEHEGSAGTYIPPGATDRGIAIGEGAIGRVGRNGLPYFSNDVAADADVDDQEGALREGIAAVRGLSAARRISRRRRDGDLRTAPAVGCDLDGRCGDRGSDCARHRTPPRRRRAAAAVRDCRGVRRRDHRREPEWGHRQLERRRGAPLRIHRARSDRPPPFARRAREPRPGTGRPPEPCVHRRAREAVRNGSTAQERLARPRVADDVPDQGCGRRDSRRVRDRPRHQHGAAGSADASGERGTLPADRRDDHPGVLDYGRRH